RDPGPGCGRHDGAVPGGGADVGCGGAGPDVAIGYCIITFQTPPPNVVMYTTWSSRGSNSRRWVARNGIALNSSHVSPASRLSQVPWPVVVTKRTLGSRGWRMGANGSAAGSPAPGGTASRRQVLPASAVL